MLEIAKKIQSPIKTTLLEIFETLVRFPVECCLSVAFTFAAIYLTYNSIAITEHYLLRNFLIISIPAFSFFLSLSLIMEERQITFTKRLIIRLLALLLFTIYFIFSPQKLLVTFVIQNVLLIFAFNNLVSFAPYIFRKNSTYDFWTFNNHLLLNLLQSFLYSAILTFGICVAIFVIEKLFAIQIQEKYYLYVGYIFFGIFNIWFFLTDIPKNFIFNTQDESQHKSLQVFTHILIPLTAIYLLILYIYLGKILWTWSLPNGWVAYLVLSFSGLGILSFLISAPLPSISIAKWTLNIGKKFYVAFLPLIALLFVAIFLRINEYGITEKRYLVLAFAIWLLFITIYQLIHNLKKIKIIPISLTILVVLISFGPWGISAVSRTSQINRLKNILAENSMWSGEFATKTDDKLPFGVVKEISSIVSYINDYHGISAFKPIIAQNIEQEKTKNNELNENKLIMNLLGLNYIELWESEINEQTTLFFYEDKGRDKKALDVSTFNYHIIYSAYIYPEDSLNSYKQVYFSENDSILISYNNNKQALCIAANNKIIEMNFNEFVKSLKQDYPGYYVPSNEFQIENGNEQLACKILFQNLSGTEENNLFQLVSMNATILIKTNFIE